MSETDDMTWSCVPEDMRAALAELQAAIARLTDARLEEPMASGMSSIYVTLHGVIQHSLYHAGQIAILKKQLERNQDE